MSENHERYKEWAAAYVLSALEPGERAEFERHLQGCELCQRDVQDFAALPGLLRQLDDDIEIDELAIERVTRNANSRIESGWHEIEQRLRRWRAGALAAVAALLFVAGLSIGSLGFGSASDDSNGAGIELAHDTEAEGSIVMSPGEWGTGIEVELVGLPEREVYQLWTVDTAGEWQPIVSWPSPPGGFAGVKAGTELPPEQIDRFVITEIGNKDDVVLTSMVASR